MKTKKMMIINKDWCGCALRHVLPIHRTCHYLVAPMHKDYYACPSPHPLNIKVVDPLSHSQTSKNGPMIVLVMTHDIQSPKENLSLFSMAKISKTYSQIPTQHKIEEDIPRHLTLIKKS